MQESRRGRVVRLAFATSWLGVLACVSAPPPPSPIAPRSAPTLGVPASLWQPCRSREERGVSCAAGDWSFFTPPPPGDPWSYRIGGWQVRQRAAHGFAAVQPRFELPPPVAAQPPLRDGYRRPGSLASRYEEFLRFEIPVFGTRREIAEHVLRFVQSEARTRFVEDGPIDHWPTLAEMLASEGDDCDGLELLSFDALQRLGFGESAVYRAIVHRPGIGQHHMVTFWFEDAHDPWVLDPTATITTRLQRLSELDGWAPLKMFTEHDEFTVAAIEDKPLLTSPTR